MERQVTLKDFNTDDLVLGVPVSITVYENDWTLKIGRRDYGFSNKTGECLGSGYELEVEQVDDEN